MAYPATDESATSAGTKSRRLLSATGERLAKLPAYASLSRTVTDAPARPGTRSARIARTKCEPMNPAPPVTKSLIAVRV